eukprot:scaffold137814_cov27-Tisochrysis_lutea.AAC.2
MQGWAVPTRLRAVSDRGTGRGSRESRRCAGRGLLLGRRVKHQGRTRALSRASCRRHGQRRADRGQRSGAGESSAARARQRSFPPRPEAPRARRALRARAFYSRCLRRARAARSRSHPRTQECILPTFDRPRQSQRRARAPARTGS